MADTGEKAWVRTVQTKLEPSIQRADVPGVRTKVDSCYRLPYACEILRYEPDSDTAASTSMARYETDLLIYDDLGTSGWIPRVVVECKIIAVTTHDVLTYSAKASTHKHVHPYLRYGILIGSYGDAVPARLVRHGAYFDFMMVWADADPSVDEWQDLIEVLVQEVQASRLLQQLLTDRTKGRQMFKLLHRPLRLKPAAAAPLQVPATSATTDPEDATDR